MVISAVSIWIEDPFLSTLFPFIPLFFWVFFHSALFLYENPCIRLQMAVC